MNAHQQLYFDQAVSDWEIFHHLVGKPACHRLHYLQMCTEKLGKAFYYKKPPYGKGHAGFPKFLRLLSNRKNIWKSLGFERAEDLRIFLQESNDLATAIEQLAPQLAGDGPNPEYPWPPPPKAATDAPVHFSFPIWEKLERTRKGQRFQGFIAVLIRIFPRWF